MGVDQEIVVELVCLREVVEGLSCLEGWELIGQ